MYNQQKSKRELLRKASTEGNIIILNSILQPDKIKEYNLLKYDFNDCMMAAAANGHVNIVQIFINLGADFIYPSTRIAVKYQKINVVKFLISKLNKHNCNYLMVYAARKGYKDIVQLLAGTYATDYDFAMIQAASRGHKDIVQILINLGATNYTSAKNEASLAGYDDIVQILLEYETASFSWYKYLTQIIVGYDTEDNKAAYEFYKDVSKMTNNLQNVNNMLVHTLSQ